jgi:hypothetical protein
VDTKLERLDEVEHHLEEWEHLPWAFRSPSYRALNLRFGVRSTDPDAGTYLDHVLSGLCSGQEEPDVWYSIGCSDLDAERPYSLFFGSELIAQVHSRGFAIETLLWHLNAVTVDGADPFVVLHAGGVVLEEAGVIISGPSGAGKTTLTAALVRDGFSYLTDEALAIDPATSLLQPYPKALTIQRGSWELLADLRPPHSDFSPRVWHVAPTDIRPNAIAAAARPTVVVLLPTREGLADGGGVAGLEEVSRSEAAVQLAQQCFGLSARAAPTLPVLADILSSCACFRLFAVDLDCAVQSIRDLMRRVVA